MMNVGDVLQEEAVQHSMRKGFAEARGGGLIGQ